MASSRVAVALTGLVTVGLTVVIIMPAAAQPEPSCGTAWTDYDRPPTHSGQTKLADIEIPMSDGTILRGDVFLPAGGPDGPFPTLLSINAYNRTVGYFAPNQLLLPRGYAHVLVDDRGTGTSEGEWTLWDERTQQDYAEILDWIDGQPWSDGIGMIGPSYLGITGLLAGAQQHPALEAIYSVVPAGDLYRDILYAGGQVNASFIPIWLGLLTAASFVPAPGTLDDPNAVATTLADHLVGFAEFGGGTIPDALTAGETQFDSEFWRLRSPLESVDRIEVPTFIVGGLDDLFQRGEPMLYEALRANGVDTRLVIGPWAHVTPFIGLGAQDTSGVPSLDAMALRWFDEHMLGIEHADAECIPPVTQWMRGPDQWAISPDWPHPDLRAMQWFLGGDGSLTPAPAEGNATGIDAAGRSMLPTPVSGVCSREAHQWMAGLLAGTPCETGSDLTDLFEVVYLSEPFEQDLEINGPIQADIWLTSTTADAALTVRVADVAPDGTAVGVTAGSLLASQRAVDPSRARMVDGLSIQPWHPFTETSKEPVGDEPVLVPVEVFPTSAIIRAGHRLKVTIGPIDFPHNLPSVPDIANLVGGVTTILHGGDTASRLVVPVVGAGSEVDPVPGDEEGTTSTPTTGPAALVVVLGLGLAMSAGARRR